MGRVTMLTALCLIVFAACLPAMAQQAAPAKPAVGLDIPVYAGAKVMMELSMSDQDLLPTIKEAVRSLGGTTSGPVPEPLRILRSLDMTLLGEALAGLEVVKCLAYTVPAGTTPEAVGEFYDERLREAGWSRILLFRPDGRASLNVYAKGREGMLGVFVQQRGDGLMVGAGGALGTVDVPKLMEWARNALSRIHEVHQVPMKPVPPAKGAPPVRSAPPKKAPAK